MTSIFKHFDVVVSYRDGSVYKTSFTSQGSVMRFLDQVTLTETTCVSVTPVWSKKGESVKVKVRHQA